MGNFQKSVFFHTKKVLFHTLKNNFIPKCFFHTFKFFFIPASSKANVRRQSRLMTIEKKSREAGMLSDPEVGGNGEM
jgi:hypothetical protein